MISKLIQMNLFSQNCQWKQNISETKGCPTCKCTPDS